MDSDSENKVKGTESAVKALQAVLFPPQLTCSGSYFSNFLVKCQCEDEDDSKYRVRESSSKDWSLNKEINFTLQPSRWPTECQVLEERVKHISYVPPSIEPYYVSTGNECQPKPTGDECGIIVYQYTPISAVNYFSRSSVGGSNYLLSTNLCPEQDTLKFESRFESANLARAIMITPNFYELHLRSDLYTNRHMQWFYFRVTNTKKGFLYRFSITNCSKESSLYNEGMKPLMYSTKDSQLHSIGWRRCGHNITYYSNENAVPEDPDQPMTYTLSFTVKFPHDDDEVYLAHCYPYTYSDLQDYLSEIATHPVKSIFSSVRLLCKTLAGNNVYYVTITSPAVPGDNRKKRAVVITARVHPGETPSSWMMKGILDFLMSDSGPAKELRDKFIFKIVPMLNPDGVIVGNNRCSLSAKDLNRQYRTVIRDAYPSIWYTKLMVRRLLEECGVAMYCDLHGHSRKHNIFLYGCENRRGSEKRLQEQVFPLMLHKNTAEKFSFENCKFRVQKSKEGTGRVVMWMMGIANSYTMEASFAGSTLGNRTDTHFTTQDFEQMGKSFCQTLLDYYDDDPRKEKLKTKIIDRLTKEGSNADEPTNIRLSDYSSDEGGSSSTSDEVGRGDEIVIPSVPPPSPAIDMKKMKVKPVVPQKAKAVNKSPSTKRKPLPICKATLKLSLSEKDSDSSTSSDSEIEKNNAFRLRRQRNKRSMRNKKAVQDYSDCEVHTRITKRTISVFDIIPGDNLHPDIFIPKSRTQARIITEKKYQTTRQLTEVQAKLFSLKNKLWFGTGNGDSPIAWVNHTTLPKKKKTIPKKKKKSDKATEKVNKDAKSRMEQNEKTTKNQNGWRRQIAIDYPAQGKKIAIRRSKSLPETPSNELVQCRNKGAISGDEEKQDKKKKKKRGKFVKKAKVVNNAKQFTRKD